MSHSTIKQLLNQFILRQFSQARTRTLTDDTPLLETGVVDSLGVLDLVSFIESEFEISVEDEELLPEYFNSIERIATFVQNKQNETGALSGSRNIN